MKKPFFRKKVEFRGEIYLFDPTIFDNLKVVIEGAVYDLDAVGVILVTNRSDRVELATMSRYYGIQFREQDSNGEGTAEVQLFAETEDLVAEIFEMEDRFTGCRLKIRFETTIVNPDQECPTIKELLEEIWENNPQIIQQITVTYGEDPQILKNRITLDFGRKINEQQIEDMGTFIDHVLHSLQRINQLNKNIKGD